MDRKLIVVLVAGAALLLAAVWFFLADTPEAGSTAGVLREEKIEEAPPSSP